jgi:hypothetical protein
MKVYLYVPEDLDASEYLITAAQNNIDQIIHGSSDILKDLKYNHNEVSAINVPEFCGVWMESVVFPTDTDVPLVFIDEWSNEKGYSKITAVIDEIDLENPKKHSTIEEVELNYDDKNSYYYKFSFKNIGEYRINLMAEFLDGEKTLIESKDIIVFRGKNGN